MSHPTPLVPTHEPFVALQQRALTNQRHLAVELRFWQEIASLQAQLLSVHASLKPTETA